MVQNSYRKTFSGPIWEFQAEEICKDNQTEFMQGPECNAMVSAIKEDDGGLGGSAISTVEMNGGEEGRAAIDEIQGGQDGEENDQSLAKPKNFLDEMQVTPDAGASNQSLPLRKSVRDEMQDDLDGNLAGSLAKIRKRRRSKNREGKDILEGDTGSPGEAFRGKKKGLSKASGAEDLEDTLADFKKKIKGPKPVKDMANMGSVSRQASASEKDIKEDGKPDSISKQQTASVPSQGSPPLPAQKARVGKATKASKASLESSVEGVQKGSAGKALETSKGKKPLDSQRVLRQVRKRRHCDMAYEGDSDWDVLMNEEETLENKNSVDKERLARSRGRAGLMSSLLAQVVPGDAAAVSAGLKVRTPGPSEKIRFKEVLKRRGGLQEYLECRNLILWLWGKDVRRILPLTDCGVTLVPSEDESLRASLIRDIYEFLDYHGYINVGVAVKKPKNKVDIQPKLKLSKESTQSEKCGDKVADAEEEVAFILGQIKGTEDNTSQGQNHIQVDEESQLLLPNVEDVQRNKLTGNRTGLAAADKKESEECGIALMEIDESPLVAACIEENATLAIAGSSIVKTEDATGSDGPNKVNAELGTRNSSQSDGATEEFSGKGPEVKAEADPDVKVASALEQIKNSYGEDEFSDIDSAKVLHNLSKCDSCIDNQAMTNPASDNKTDASSVLKGQKKIIVVGAGPAGLVAARHLQRLNFHVTVLEARDRVGGRVYTDRSSLSVPVDLGASIITGVEADVATERRPDPSALFCTQLGLELTVLNSDCPLYDSVTGQKVPANLDQELETEYNSLLDDVLMLVAQNGDAAMSMSLEEGLEYALKKRRDTRSSAVGLDTILFNDLESTRSGLSLAVQGSCGGGIEQSNKPVDASQTVISENNAPIVGGMESGIDRESPQREVNLTGSDVSEQQSLTPLERRVMDWHFANLEYGCATELSRVSLPYWNQDDVYGGFGGAHCMIKGGYSVVMEALGEGLSIQLGHTVTEIAYTVKDSKKGGIKKEVKVCTGNGSEFVGDAVLITVPLGCLKANTIKFSPALPDWKLASIQRLGFGVLNKVVMEFPEVFWDESVDYFGATAEKTELRGQCFMFWNLKRTVDAPVLIALVVGKAAVHGLNRECSDHVSHAVMVLRTIFGEAAVPDPIASVVTNWGIDPFTRGAYSYVAVGASGEDYDILGRPVENCLFFAGEATCKEHPDTVGGALMSGLREAVRIIDILENGEDSTAEAEAMAAAQRQSDSERTEVRDMVKRLSAGELSNVLCKGSLNGEHKPLSKDALLQDMFKNAKTTAGRLFLAKEMLQLPVSVVKAFAGTKEGLGILNTWILDSMGKDGTQLLRHCVRLLLIVSTDMLAVRQSGVGRTIKEKVCVHASRDIRAVASQLVKMWIEVFRKGKAANGGLKLLKQPSGAVNVLSSSDAVKAKSKEQNSGKPSPKAANDAEANSLVPSSTVEHSSPSPIKKNLEVPSIQVEAGIEVKREAISAGDQGFDQEQPSMSDDNAISELEAAAIAAAEAARAAAVAAAEAYATSEAECSSLRELPKIPSFHKFARREHYAQKDDSEVKKKKWSGGVLGKQDCTSEIDSRSCRVRNWSVDFAATCGNLDSSRITALDYGDGNILPTVESNKKFLMGESHAQQQRSYSNDVDSHSSLKERSAETGAVDSRLTKGRVQNAVSLAGGRIHNTADKRQSYTVGSDSESLDQSVEKLNDKYSAKIVQQPIDKPKESDNNKCAAEAGSNRGSPRSRNGHKDEGRGSEHIKKCVSDYVAALLMPLYKTRKIDKNGYKSIMKKSMIKVMEHNTPAENAMAVSEFLDCKRRNKIRSLVDKFIERYMASTEL